MPTAPTSRLYLPKVDSPPATILAHLITRFPHITEAIWRERIARGVLTASDGVALREDSSYRHGITIFYQREVPFEPEAAEEEAIIYRDAEIIVIDKPHGMPVTPAGDYLDRSLLVRLQQITGLNTLAPMHRLDRETAGVVLFTINIPARGTYHQLFAEGTVEREYLAVAHVGSTPDRKEWRVANRLERGTPWYRQRIVEGPTNAITNIELLELRAKVGLFKLKPETGKKHQLRVHMASLGFPIIGDPFYPDITEKPAGAAPLQLLATRLAFVDPLSGACRSFTSARTLQNDPR